MTISRAQIQKQLIPGLNEIIGLNYGQIVGEHEALYDKNNSDRSFEEEVLMTGLGEAVVKGEGESVTFDDAQETWTARYNHETIALAFSITEEAFEDNLYDSFSRARAEFLGRSMASTKETKAASIYNNGFSGTTNPFLTADGANLFSDTHPLIGGGTGDNLGSGDLSETALENADIDISLFRDDRGILLGAKALKLIIPPKLKFTAFKILKSDQSTTTATVGTADTAGVTNINDVNALRMGGYFPGGMAVNHRFTDDNAWFIRTDVPNGFKMFQRTPLQVMDEGDFVTGNLRIKARERYSFGVSDWRGGYGSAGS